MSKYLYILCLLTCSETIYGQELEFKQIDTSKTWNSVSKQKYLNFYFGLQDIKTSTYQLHFRILMSGQIIDLYQTENKNYQGQITNHITEYGYRKVKNQQDEQRFTKQKVFERISLNHIDVELVIRKIITSGQIEIPKTVDLDSFLYNVRQNARCTTLCILHGGGRLANSHFSPIFVLQRWTLSIS